MCRTAARHFTPSSPLLFYPKLDGRLQSLDWTNGLDWAGLALHAFLMQLDLHVDYLQDQVRQNRGSKGGNRPPPQLLNYNTSKSFEK